MAMNTQRLGNQKMTEGRLTKMMMTYHSALNECN